MKEAFESVFNAIPFIQGYPLWVRMLAAAWIVLTAGFISVLLIVDHGRASNDQYSALDVPFPSGEWRFDQVQQKLLADAGGLHYNDALLVTDLKPLFSAPIFYHISEERPGDALFRFGGCQWFLERYVNEFQDPSIRDAIGHATTRLIKLQQTLQTLYGPAFNAQAHFDKFHSKSAFLANLPAPTKAIDNAMVEDANRTLAQLVEELRRAGLK
jgi:hypothetical protein